MNFRMSYMGLQNQIYISSQQISSQIPSNRCCEYVPIIVHGPIELNYFEPFVELPLLIRYTGAYANLQR